MYIEQKDINNFLNKYICFVDSLSKKYRYDNNVRHLLYLIVPAFVVKYGKSCENLILHCFSNVKIYTSDVDDKIVSASFNRVLMKNDDGYYTDKYIVLNNYTSSPFMRLLDNIVHEFNHAINSINNEIVYDEKYVKLRTGLSYLVYDKESLRFISKSKEVSLEEVINTEQTEEVIDIINSFGNYDIENAEFSNMLFALKNEVNGKEYVSSAYYFQSVICDVLMKNKTFTPTITNLRIKGFVEDIPFLFDNVLGRKGSYIKLNSLLNDIHDLEIKYSKARMFKSFILNKLKGKAQEVISLIYEYDRKCIYK